MNNKACNLDFPNNKEVKGESRSREYFLHAGYYLELDQKSIEFLEKHNRCTLTKTTGKYKPKTVETSVFLAIKEKPYTCIVYFQKGSMSRFGDSKCNSSDNVKSWFFSKKNDGNEHFLFARNLFVDYKHGVMVLEGTIDGTPAYVNLTKESYNNMTAVSIKKSINSGEIGTKISIPEVLKIKAIPCAFVEGEKYREQVMVK